MANAFLLKPLTITVPAATSTAVGVTSNLTNDYAGVIWTSGSGTLTDLYVDLGGDTVIDTLMLFGVELAPSAAQLQIFAATAAQGGSFGPVTWTGAAQALYAGTAAMTNGKGVALWSVTPGSLAAVRYLLIRFTNATAFSIRLSRVVCGTRFQPTRNFSFGAGFGVRDLGSLDFSRRGVLLRTRGARLRTTALGFSSLRKDEVEASARPLLEYLGNTELVALCTDPTADAQRMNRCYFGPLVGDLGVTWRNAAAWEAKINLASIF